MRSADRRRRIQDPGPQRLQSSGPLRRHNLFSIATALIILNCLLLAQSACASDVSIVHAGWLLARPGEAPLQQSIIIENSRITHVVAGYVDDPDALLIDLSDAFVLPGLIDSHVHLASAPDPSDLSGAMIKSEADYALSAAYHAQIALQWQQGKSCNIGCGALRRRAHVGQGRGAPPPPRMSARAGALDAFTIMTRLVSESTLACKSRPWFAKLYLGKYHEMAREKNCTKLAEEFWNVRTSGKADGPGAGCHSP